MHARLRDVSTMAMQVVLQFPEAFWDGAHDFWGAALDGGVRERGRCFMFWNLHRFTQQPQLTALLSGDAANHVRLLSSGTNRCCHVTNVTWFTNIQNITR